MLIYIYISVFVNFDCVLFGFVIYNFDFLMHVSANKNCKTFFNGTFEIIYCLLPTDSP